MRHLLSCTVYDDRSLLGGDPAAALSSVGADGIELLTSYGPPDTSYYSGAAVSVHLPYATDWLAAWEGRPYDMDEDYSRFYMYGRSREEVIDNLRTAMECASVLEPAYGVLHASNGGIGGLFLREPWEDSGRVLEAFAEMVNTVVSRFPGGEPPFTILFENLWWPGLRLLDDSDFRILERRVEFDDWGFCVDTGHMMNCLPGIRSERDGIDALERIFEGYSGDLVDRVGAMHLHWSASWDYRSSFEEREPGDDLMAFISDAFSHISRIDMHMPFSDPGCVRLVELLDPGYVTHELPGSAVGVLEDFRQQRSLFPRSR